MPSVSNVLDSIIAWTNLHLHLDPIHTLLQAIRASYANWKFRRSAAASWIGIIFGGVFKRPSMKTRALLMKTNGNTYRKHLQMAMQTTLSQDSPGHQDNTRKPSSVLLSDITDPGR